MFSIVSVSLLASAEIRGTAENRVREPEAWRSAYSSRQRADARHVRARNRLPLYLCSGPGCSARRGEEVTGGKNAGQARFAASQTVWR